MLFLLFLIIFFQTNTAQKKIESTFKVYSQINRQKMTSPARKKTITPLWLKKIAKKSPEKITLEELGKQEEQKWKREKKISDAAWEEATRLWQENLNNPYRCLEDPKKCNAVFYLRVNLRGHFMSHHKDKKKKKSLSTEQPVKPLCKRIAQQHWKETSKEEACHIHQIKQIVCRWSKNTSNKLAQEAISALATQADQSSPDTTVSTKRKRDEESTTTLRSPKMLHSDEDRIFKCQEGNCKASFSKYLTLGTHCSNKHRSTKFSTPKPCSECAHEQNRPRTFSYKSTAHLGRCKQINDELKRKVELKTLRRKKACKN